jgi:phosphoglycerate dehydrogenase-like enzyme
MKMKKNLAVLMASGTVRDMFIPPATAARINETYQAEWNPHSRSYTPQETAKALETADYCISGWGAQPYTKEVIENAKNLKVIAHTGGSVATIVSNELYERGIVMLSGNDVYARSVAEGTVAYMLAGLRRIPLYTNNVQAGLWGGIDSWNEGLLEQTVGLMGLGAIARYTAGFLAAFNVTLYGYDPYVSDEVFEKYGITRVGTPEELCAKVRVLSLHMPKTKETYHMLDKRHLSLMPDGALLVNTARGSVINEGDLAAELKTGRISAVLDVYEQEPLPMDSGLRKLDNVILLPHMAGPTKDRFPLVTESLLDDLARHEAGKALLYEIPKAYAFAMTNDGLKV